MHGRWPGRWCMVYTGGQEDREPRVSLASREEISGESIVSPAQRGRVLGRRPREQPSDAPESQAVCGLEGVEGLTWARADLQSEVQSQIGPDSGGEEAGSGDRQRWAIQLRNVSLKGSRKERKDHVLSHV